MKRLLYSLLFVLAVALPLLPAATGRDLADQILLPERVLARADELSLTAEQRTDLLALQQHLRATLADSLPATRRATDALAEQLATDSPDEASILAQFDTLNAAESSAKRERLLVTVRIRRLLTATQLSQLRSPDTAAHVATPGPAFTRSNTRGLPASSGRASIPQLLREVREKIALWRAAGRDLTEVDALWAKFRSHAAAREHALARQSLEQLIALLSTASADASASTPAAPPALPSPAQPPGNP